MNMDRRTFARLLASAAACGGAGLLTACQGREDKTQAEAPLPATGEPQRRPISTARYTGPETWVRSVPGVGPYVSLTFDDGPHPLHTPRLLDILAREGVLATFFVIGKNVQSYPGVAQRIVAEGHEIANHTWSHPDLMLLAESRVAEEIERCQTVIQEVTGRTPTLFRPPYGSFSRARGGWLKSTYGLTTVMWSVDPQDWRLPGTSVVAQRMLAAVHQGAILLAHDIHAPTIEAMRTVVPGLKSRGYTCLTTSGLLAKGPAT
ncbi:MAG: polysaccharide deacetylase family protein [Verrucomicrobiia bacterium]